MIKEINNRFYDNNNNSWDTKELAEKYSPTLRKCNNCNNCNNCDYCNNCNNCNYCDYCNNCNNCNNCYNCNYCDYCNNCNNCKVSPITLNTNHWQIYIRKCTDTITIGCQTHTIKKWLNFTDEEISIMHNEALSFWKIYKPIINLLIETRN